MPHVSTDFSMILGMLIRADRSQKVYCAMLQCSYVSVLVRVRRRFSTGLGMKIRVDAYATYQESLGQLGCLGHVTVASLETQW
eukprot:1448606-Rhodomonas_salina.3